MAKERGVLRELKALYRGLKLYDDLKSLDNTAFEWSIWSKRNEGEFDEEDRRDFWKCKISYEKKVKALVEKVGRFIKDYRVSPILDFDEFKVAKVTVGFMGKWVKGYKILFLDDGEWFRELKLPKPPRKLVEVFE